MNDAFVLSGKLSEIKLPTLLMSLHRDGETGVLSLADGHFKRNLYVKEGKVVFATSTNPDDRLGECLLRRGLITVPQYLESTRALSQGRRQGQVLVDMGALTPESLVEGVTQQLYDIVFSLFELREGTYQLKLAAFSSVEMITLSVEIPFVVFRGMDRLTSWGPIFAAMGDPATRLRHAADMPAFVPHLELTPDQEHVLGLCRHGMAISSILDASYFSHFQTYRLLWILLTMGIIEREAEGRKAQDGASSPEALLDRYNDLYAYIHHHVDAVPEGAEAVRSALDGVAQIHPEFASCQEELALYGRLDVDATLWALRTLPESERPLRLQAFLEEVLYALAHVAESTLPEAAREAVRDYIRSKARCALGGS